MPHRSTKDEGQIVSSQSKIRTLLGSHLWLLRGIATNNKVNAQHQQQVDEARECVKMRREKMKR